MSGLADGLLGADGKPRDVSALATDAGKRFVELGIDPSLVDLFAECLARWADGLDPVSARVDVKVFRELASELGVPAEVVDALAQAFTRQLNKAELAALAMHVVDITEAMAFAVFGPELPALSAKADRSGGAARSAGVAKRLRG